MSLAYTSFVITYRRPEIVSETLKRLFGQTYPPSSVLVIDNGCCEETQRICLAENAGPVEYVSLEENMGPAGAAARGFQWASQNESEWVLWIDDDDPPPFSDTVECLLRLIEEHGDGDVGGVAAVGARWDWRVGETARVSDEELSDEPLEVDAIGGNQSLLLRLCAVEEVGGANVSLFFGLEEIELCLRLRRADFRLLVSGSLMRRCRAKAGRLGFRRRRALVPELNPNKLWRRYYTTRNYVFLMRNTFGRPDLARREAAKSLVRCLFALSRSPRLGAPFCVMQVRGVLDGYRGRMGRTVEPA